MSGIACIVLTAYGDRRHNFVVFKGHPAGSEEKVFQRQLAGSVLAFDRYHSIEGDKRCGAIGTGHAVAKIAADGGHVAHLGSANGENGLRQDGNVFADQRGISHMRKAGQGPDDNIPVLVLPDEIELGNVVNIDQVIKVSFALMQFDQRIRAAGDQSRLRIFLQ